ncbi:unnamed protein product, partial [Durusdinium trenchii]
PVHIDQRRSRTSRRSEPTYRAASGRMGGAFCRICCNRPSESGDALDSLNKSWPEKQTEDFVKLAASCRDRNYVNFMMCMTFSGFPKLNPGERQIPFEVQKSPIVEGLGLLEHSQSNTPETMKQVAQILSSSKSVIVGSVRMGYGHHRIAYSALTWALELGGKPFLLDILSPDCVEAAVVRNMDKRHV